MAVSVTQFAQVSTWATSPASIDITGLAWSTNDVIVVVGMMESDERNLATPVNANLSFTLRASSTTGGTVEGTIYIWTAVAGSNQTSQSITLAEDTGSSQYGGAAWVLGGASGSFANASANLTESGFTFTPTAGSGVIYGISDWNANATNQTIATGTGTATERADSASSNYGWYLGDWMGVTASSTTFGVTSYTGLKVAHAVIEVLAAGGTDATVTATTVATTTAAPAPAKQTGSVVSATAAATAAALPAPTITAVTAISPATIVTTVAMPAPAVQTGSVLAGTAIATVTALPAPAVQTGSVVAANAIVTTIALPPPTVQTGTAVAATAIATTTALPAAGVSTGPWANHVTVAAGRNGTADHTVHPDGTGGSVVDGAAFTPTSGSFLLCLVAGAVTSTTPTGWTLPTDGSAISGTGLYVFYRAVATGDGDDEVATTHNGSNYPAVFDFYELPAGTAFIGVERTAGVGNGAGGPTLSGLTGTNLVAGVMSSGSTAGTNTTTWSDGVTEVDLSVATVGTDGYSYSLTYDPAYSSATAQWSATLTEYLGAGVERFMLAVNTAGVVDATVTAVTVVTVASLPAPSVDAQAVVSPSVIATVAALPVPAIQTGSTVAATAISTVAAMPAPTVLSGTVVSPAVIATVAALPAPAIQTGSVVTATAIATVTAMPAPTVSTGSNATITATAIATVVEIPEVEQADATVAPATVATTASVGVASVQTAGNATVAATSVVTVTALPAPTVQTGSTPSPSTITTAVAAPAPTVETAGNATIAATTIVTSATLPAPSISTGSGATVAATAIATQAVLPAPTVQQGQTVSATAVSTVTGLSLPSAIGPPIGIQGNAYPASTSTATGTVYPASGGGIIGLVA